MIRNSGIKRCLGMGEWLFHHLLEAEEEPEKETELGKSRVTNKTKLLRKKKG